MMRATPARLSLAALTILGITAPVSAKRIPMGPVPVGWSVDKTAIGDLTGDNVADSVMVIRKNDPAMVVRNSGWGMDVLDTNPRRLLIYQRTGAGGFKLLADKSGLIPSAGSQDVPCLADPLEEGGISIERQVLSITLNYWLSCGSYGVMRNTFKFRREGTRFRLIGFDRTEFMRSSGQGEQFSVNFLTNRQAVSPFAIDESVPERWKWSRIKPQRHYLDSLNLGACTRVSAQVSLC